MEKFILQKQMLFHLLQKENYELLNSKERELYKDFLEKYKKNYILLSATNGFSFIFAKLFIINRIKNIFLRSFLDLSTILFLTKFTKILFDKHILVNASNLDESLNNNSYLCKNSIHLSNSKSIENKELNDSGLFFYNLDNFTQINLFALVVIRIML